MHVHTREKEGGGNTRERQQGEGVGGRKGWRKGRRDYERGEGSVQEAGFCFLIHIRHIIWVWVRNSATAIRKQCHSGMIPLSLRG